MSTSINNTPKIKRVTVPDIASRKNGEPIVSLTAYTAPMTKILDPYCDFLLVGDSLGMVLYGMESTLTVTLDMMINHGAAVVRASNHACIIVDMPFGSYQESQSTAYRNCARVMIETGCAAVKIEGGVEMADTVKFLTERGIPVMGHIGLKPQSVNINGGFRPHGFDSSEALKIKEDAESISRAGAFAIVIEGVKPDLAEEITREIPTVTIGIGASAECDGQVLVTEDAIGMFSDFTPKFVKRFAEVGEEINLAVKQYADEVKTRTFPSSEHYYVRK
ncbi:MAG: 3-methyl-2-oxobutanoate hydroxymethyltransferase [Rhodospirillales bacterium]|nr:3-methyl-2-oxobutanoate hydroxymethyltransferase [Rhodospirillales bacterium]